MATRNEKITLGVAGGALALFALLVGVALDDDQQATEDKPGPTVTKEVPAAPAPAPEEETYVDISATKTGYDATFDNYTYRVTLTNETGEPLDVAFSITGLDSSGNSYNESCCGAGFPVNTLADGQTTSGTFSFETDDLATIVYDEPLGVDSGEGPVS